MPPADGYGACQVEAVHVYPGQTKGLKAYFVATSRDDEVTLRKARHFVVMGRSGHDWQLFLTPDGVMVECPSSFIRELVE